MKNNKKMNASIVFFMFAITFVVIKNATMQSKISLIGMLIIAIIGKVTWGYLKRKEFDIDKFEAGKGATELTVKLKVLMYIGITLIIVCTMVWGKYNNDSKQIIEASLFLEDNNHVQTMFKKLNPDDCNELLSVIEQDMRPCEYTYGSTNDKKTNVVAIDKKGRKYMYQFVLHYNNEYLYSGAMNKYMLDVNNPQLSRFIGAWSLDIIVAHEVASTFY